MCVLYEYTHRCSGGYTLITLISINIYHHFRKKNTVYETEQYIRELLRK